MALILSIDTALEQASVLLGNSDRILAAKTGGNPMTHAAFVQPAIQEICDETDIALNQIDAVAVSAGPGSYTGLRVGLSSAKGLCFALNKPLILLNTLEILAKEAILKINKENALYCPMIDARRMEVFAALYNYSLNELIKTKNFILTENDFPDLINQYKNEIIFFGNGSAKWQEIAPRENFIFYAESLADSRAINILAQKYFYEKVFADLAYSEPLYAKNFFTTMKLNS